MKIGFSCQYSLVSNAASSLSERDADFKASAPDEVAHHLQSVVGHNPVKSRRDFSAQLGNLQRALLE